MYEFISGKLISSSPVCVIVEANGIGYKLFIPFKLFGELPQTGSHLLFYTSFVIRELSQTLYGFIKKEERELFNFLITLSGIGPKTALGIIGHLELSELKQAVLDENSVTLTKIPGIGKKTAERLLLDLKGKLDAFDTGAILKKRQTIEQDALSALLNLGYTQTHAEKAIKKAYGQLDDKKDLSKLLSLALRGSP